MDLDTTKQEELLRMLGRAHRHEGVAEKVILSVGSAIVEGRLHPGDDLNSVDLAKTFGTSRTPIREALMTLEREGLVEVPPRRRPRVARLDVEQVRQIYELRATLDELVSRLVVERAADEELAELRAQHRGLEEAAAAGDVDEYFWRNVTFRHSEAALARNDQLLRIQNSLGLRTLQLRHLSISLPNRMQVSLLDHERLLEAYEERDAQLAGAIARSIVRRGLEAIESSGWTDAARPPRPLRAVSAS